MSRMRVLSASGIERAMICQASQTLPGVNTIDEYNSLGVVKHKFIYDARHIAAVVGARDEAGRESARQLALAAIVDAEEREQCAVIDIEAIDRFIVLRMTDSDDMAEYSEEPFRFDPVSGKAEINFDGQNRNYSDPQMIYGTPDTVIVSEKKALVIDWKTGFNAVAPAKENWQLRTLAAMVARAFGCDEVIVAIAYIRDDGSAHFDWAELSEMDFDADIEALAKLHKKCVNTAKIKVPDVTAGPHCKYCPALLACPAHTSLVRVALGAAVEVGETPLPLSTLDMGELYAKLIIYRGAIEKLTSQIEEVAKSLPIGLPDGRTLAAEETSRESIAPAVALRVLEDAYGAEVAEAAMNVTVTKTSIKSALGKKTKEALDKIATAGGVIVTKKMSVKLS